MREHVAHLVRASLPALSRAELPELEPHSGPRSPQFVSSGRQASGHQNVYFFSYCANLLHFYVYNLSPHRSYVEGDRRSKVKGLPTLLTSKKTKG